VLVVVIPEQDVFGFIGSNNFHDWNIHNPGRRVSLAAVRIKKRILLRQDQGKILYLQPLAFEGGRKLMKTPMPVLTHWKSKTHNLAMMMDLNLNEWLTNQIRSSNDK